MNGPSFTTTRKDDLPSCFGKDWDRNVPECAGGPENGYIHPKNGSHVREQCNFFTSCGARTQARNMSLIPTSSLLRPPVVTPPPQQTAPQNFSDYIRQQQAQHVEQQRLAGMTGARPVVAPAVVPQAQQITPQMQQHLLQQAHLHYPATTYGLNYQMPSYLSTPEVHEPGESVWSVLMREVVRSMFKALGHAVSHFFDARTLKGK